MDGTAMLKKVDYKGYVPSCLPGWTHTMDNIPCITPAEVVYTKNVGDSAKPLKLRRVQKSVAVLKTLVVYYSTHGSILLEPFCVTFGLAKACLTTP